MRLRRTSASRHRALCIVRGQGIAVQTAAACVLTTGGMSRTGPRNAPGWGGRRGLTFPVACDAGAKASPWPAFMIVPPTIHALAAISECARKGGQVSANLSRRRCSRSGLMF